MSVQQKIARLQNFIANNRALAGVPFGFVRGSPITPITALSMLQRGENVQEITGELAKLGIDPPTLTNEDWVLAEEYYNSLLRVPKPSPKVYKISESGLTVEQCLAHIQARDQIGQSLVQANKSLRYEMAKRMGRV
jgi:hypothetical protein